MFAASDSVGRTLDIYPRAKYQLCPTHICAIARQPDSNPGVQWPIKYVMKENQTVIL